jgi:hypothetical protein
MDEGLYRFVVFSGFLNVGFIARLTGRQSSGLIREMERGTEPTTNARQKKFL